MRCILTKSPSLTSTLFLAPQADRGEEFSFSFSFPFLSPFLSLSHSRVSVLVPVRGYVCVREFPEDGNPAEARGWLVGGGRRQKWGGWWIGGSREAAGAAWHEERSSAPRF